MQDTSFAIHPGKQKTSNDSTFQDIGSLVEFNQSNYFIHLKLNVLI